MKIVQSQSDGAADEGAKNKFGLFAIRTFLSISVKSHEPKKWKRTISLGLTAVAATGGNQPKVSDMERTRQLNAAAERKSNA